MRLKNLGIVNSVIESIGKGASDINAVTNAVRDLSVANTMAVLNTTNLSDAQKINILMSKGVSQAKAEELIATNSVTVANTTAAASTGVLTGATTSLSASLKGLWATMLANPLTTIITIATTAIAVIAQFVSMIQKAEAEALESAKQLKQEYSDLFTSLDNNVSTLKGLENEFKKLSVGVGDYGENISLTADEYERYQEIVQTIVGISPELIAGYDDEGNAIANKNGLLEKSIALMQEEQRLKMQEMVTDSNLWKLAKVNIKEIEEYQDSIEDVEMSNSLAYSGVKINKNGEKEYGYIHQIDEYISSVIGIQRDTLNESIPEYIANNIDAVYKNIDKILNKSGKEFSDKSGNKWAGITEEQQELLRQYILDIKQYTDKIDDSSSEFNESLQLIPQTLTQYKNLNYGSKDFLSRWVRSFEIDANTSKKEIAAISEEIKEFTKTLSKDSDLQNVIDLGVQLESNYNDTKLTVEEYKQQIQEFLNSISNFDDGVQAKIRLAFGFKGDDTEWKKQVDKKIKRVKNILVDEYDNEVSTLTMNELEIAYNISASEGSLTFDELIQKIDETVNAINGVKSADEIYNSLKGTIYKLKSAIDEYNKSGQVSADIYRQVIALNEDYADLFDFSSGKISIAADEVDNLVKELIEEYGATMAANGATEAQITQMVALANSLSNVKEEATDVIDTIKDLTDILRDAVDGTEMTVFETWELIEKYPELASAISKTTNGYILEAEAVKKLIKQRAILHKQNASDARMAAREALINGAGSVESANNVDRIFADYYNKNGTNIKSFDEWVSAHEDYWNTSNEGANWVQGLREYVEAIISDNSVNDVMNSLIEDMKDPDALFETEIEWKKFDDIQAKIKKITDESDFLLDLLDGKDMVDESGKLTEYGNAAMGLHGVNYKVYMEQAQRYAGELAKIEENLANDPNNQNLIDRKEELLELQRESVLAAKDEKQAMIDLVEEGVEAELDALNDLIDKYKDALDSAKDLYDYQNKVSDITDEIGTLQKQIIAYENDTSEETKAQIQKLKVDLQEAQEELQETEYDRFISDQKKLFDNLYSDAENAANKRLEDVNANFNNQINAINTKADEINRTLETLVDSVGITLPDKIKTILGSDGGLASVIASLIKTDNSGNAGNPNGNVNNPNGGTANSSGGITNGDGNTQTDNGIKETAPNTIFTDLSKVEPIKNRTPSSSKPTSESAQSSTTAQTTEKMEKYKQTGLRMGTKVYTQKKYDSKIKVIDGVTYLSTHENGNQYSTRTDLFVKKDEGYSIKKIENGKVYMDWHSFKPVYQLKQYKKGGLADFTGLAWMDGTRSKPEAVLDAQDTENFIALRDVLSQLASDNIGLGNPMYSAFAPISYGNNLPNFDSKLAQILNSYGNSKTENHIEITIPIEKVEDYNDFVTQLQSDPKFEKMIQAMTLGRLNGGSSLAKYNYQWKK